MWENKYFFLTQASCFLRHKNIWLSLIFIQCYFISFSQENDKEAFEYIRWPRNPATGIRDKLYFYDALTRQPAKIVDLIGMNPYGNFKEKVVDTLSGYGTLVFELTTPVPNIDSYELVSSRYHPDNMDLQPFRISSRYDFSREGQNFIAVLYRMTTWNKDLRDISTHTTALVFNRRGNLVHKIEHIDVNSWNPLVTQDGKYLFFLIGGPESETAEVYVPQSFLVFDLQRKQLIYQDSIGANLVPSLIGENLFFVPNNYNPGYDEYRIFNFEKNILYSKYININESDGLIEKRMNYMKFKNFRTKEETLLHYEKDFEKNIIFDK